jgi:uncharacterized protein (UPF0218 family)
MSSLDVLKILSQALRQFDDPRINDVQVDGEEDLSEIVLSVDDGYHLTDWVIRARDITEADRAWDECP